MPTNASSGTYLYLQIVGSSGPNAVPGLIAKMKASSAAFTAADINILSDQLMGIAEYINTLTLQEQHGRKVSS